ncbi:hypothetical protein MNEG_16433, partial [Monoraphidium neglectum]
AVTGDYLSGVAYRVGVPLEKLLLDNLESLKDLDKPLAGKQLAVCAKGVTPPTQGAARDPASAPAPAPAPTPAPGPAAAPAPAKPSQTYPRATQLQALLGFKAAVDPKGRLASWSANQGAGTEYCSFKGVTCDTRKSVASIKLTERDLGGTLPSASVLAGLPALTELDLFSNQIIGTLPPEWGSLAQLETISLVGNAITGPLPRSWAGLKRLRTLFLR